MKALSQILPATSVSSPGRLAEVLEVMSALSVITAEKFRSPVRIWKVFCEITPVPRLAPVR
jgi:hypothetical protein